MEQKIKCLVVEDEPFARDLLSTYIAKIPNLELVKSCENAFDAIDLLQEQSIDILFTDIQMPNINGVELIRSLRLPPLVIFVTASPDYAVQGFELDVVDYLMKPFAFDRFLKAFNKAKTILQQKPTPPKEPAPSAHIFIRDGQKLCKLVFEDIYYVEGMKDYIKIITAQKNYIIYQRMKHMEDSLPSDQFIRIHKSYIVRINSIRNIIGNTAELSNGHSVIIARQYKQELNNRLGIKQEGTEEE
jgi:two-component system, LytTR family, response regulator